MLETLEEMLGLVQEVQDRCKLLAMCPNLHRLYERDELPTVMGLIAEAVSAGVDDPLFTIQLRLTTLIAELAGQSPQACIGENSPKAIARKIKP